MNNLDDILNLITNNLAPDQKEEVLSSIKEDLESENLYRKAKITWALMASTQKMPDYEIEKSYGNIHARISSQANQRSIFFKYFKYAAVVFAMVGMSATMFYMGRQNTGFTHALKYTSVVADKGQVSKVILPDSSVVWLNSGTTLSYNSSYSQNNRDLSLSGEAFLEVRKNTQLPLVVTSGKLMVKVLGTRFDVKAYPDDKEIKVLLESGKVELLHTSDKSFRYKIDPGQMASFDQQSNKMNICTTNVQVFSGWKKGELNFVDTPMSEVLKSLKRKFDVVFEVNSSKVYRSVFNANFKNESLKEILDYIQYTCQISYTIIPEKNGVKTKIILN